MAKKAEKKPLELIKVDKDTNQVVCDGGGGPLGHPQVWYSFDKKVEANCHYCGRKFVKKDKSSLRALHSLGFSKKILKLIF